VKKDKNDELRREYHREDLGRGVRGRYLARYRKGTNMVLLGPDVAAAFRNDASVNEALRSLMKVARQTVGRTKVRRSS
jgi:hypothetical protein